jgi:hypothetical protein
MHLQPNSEVAALGGRRFLAQNQEFGSKSAVKSNALPDGRPFFAILALIRADFNMR